MSARGPYRRHSAAFKLQLCSDIRSGKLGRREAQKTYGLSANLIQMWLTSYDQGEMESEEAVAETVAEYQARIAALERKLGELTMELDLLKKMPRRSAASNNAEFSVVSGPKPAPSDGGAK